MTKKLKAAIFAAAFISLGGAAYTYDRYGVQDNSTLLANIEAMSCNNEENKENSEGGNGSSSGGFGTSYFPCGINSTASDAKLSEDKIYICADGTTLYNAGEFEEELEKETPSGTMKPCGNKSKIKASENVSEKRMGFCYIK